VSHYTALADWRAATRAATGFARRLKSVSGVTTAVLVVMVFTAFVGVARADVNNTSIAVPLIGTEGAAGPYGSSITVVARGGAAQTGQIIVRLFNVTHPCIEDLAILLVNGSSKFLLMSNAGSCRPLQGTNVTFNAAGAPVPDTQPVTPAYGQTLTLAPSNYGPAPAFPAPAPAGPYTLGLPPASTNINGTWSLFVFDTGVGNRGVIAGGWALEYPTDAVVNSTQTLVALPGSGTGGLGAASLAGVYPITFDLTTVPVGVDVARVTIAITMRHTFPDDVRLILQSPAGTAVALMANAGGDIDIAPGSIITFADGGVALTDAGAIVTGVYSPGGVFGSGSAIEAPGPATPHQTALSAFNGQPIRGTWRLWAVDDASADAGQITSATLTIENETFPNPTLDPTPATSTQPFIHVEGVATGGVSPHHATWRVTNGTGATYYDAGPFIFIPGTQRFVADIPLKKGVNTVTYRLGNTKSQSLTTSFTTTVNEFTYSFAEGATGSFFDTDITLGNPSGANAPLSIDFLNEGGGTITLSTTANAQSPLAVSVDNHVLNGSPSTIVHSTDAVPLAAERTMIWDATGYGGHGATSVAPATRWLFAEGSQGFFDTYVLIANDNATPTDVTVRFLIEGGGVVTIPITIAAKTRHTMYAGDTQALRGQSFGIDITSVQPIIAERAMYLPGARLFEGGHESAGVNAPSRSWFLAEGSTGSFFECFVLLSNPNSTPANVTLTYLLSDGTTIPQALTLPANSRRTINVERDVDNRLAAADVSTTVTSDVGIVVERAMYWPDLSIGWREAHNSFGVTQSALRWGIADGRIGGARDFQTFILLANPNPRPAEIEVRFLKPGVTVTRTFTLTPFSRRNIHANNDVPELGAGVFSADIQVVNFQPIAVEKAMYWSPNGEVFGGGTGVTATRLPPP
jgi:subtilisin-like proprotein convertase family protein